MAELVRFSVSLEADLLDEFDRYCKENRFATRSEAIRQLLREALTAHAWDTDTREAAATYARPWALSSLSGRGHESRRSARQRRALALQSGLPG